MIKRKQNHGLDGCSRLFSRLGGIFILFLLLSACVYVLLRGAGAFLIVADELVPAKAIVILSGGTESRMNEALRIYEEKHADVIILTETGEKVADTEYLYSFDMRIQLMSNGVPSGNILMTNMEVASTVDEACAVKDIMMIHQYPSAIIVTDPYHSRRTRQIFNDVFAETDVKLYIRPVRDSWFNSRSWFLSAQGWRFILLEYTKLIGYWLGFGN